VHFTKLRLSGFKSFVEPTELLIEPGLTGVVGPNGCGKSNLVEALRWVMGETSAKQMRGGEMDDVIFGGTDRRPARNLAEVTLSLDNTDRSAPSNFNSSDEIEIVRRIERGEGSQYQVNGSETRARDVQTLFADLATGARSTALVSQGRIGALISAKPKDRRHILEEAAGITGLHSRRHEAELRLKGAETNLERLDDLLATLEEQHKALKRQARQANRYQNLSEHIRRAEAIVIHHQWMTARTDQASAKEELAASEDAVQRLTREVAVASRKETEIASTLPTLRDAEVAKAASLQRLFIERDALDFEEEQIEKEKQEIQLRLRQTGSDIEREIILESDAQSALSKLETERTVLEGQISGEKDNLAHSLRAWSDAQEIVASLENDFNLLSGKITKDETLQAELRLQIADMEARRSRIQQRLNDLRIELSDVTDTIKSREEPLRNTDEGSRIKAALEKAREEFDEASVNRQKTVEQENSVRKQLENANSQLDKLHTEERAIKKFLSIGEPDLWPPLIDAISVTAGYEKALAAALGDDLNAPTNEAAPIHWKTFTAFKGAPPLPEGIMPLSDFVSGPQALERRLSQVGLVKNEPQGNALAMDLTPGQRLVSCDGSLWRWDGFTATGGDQASAASRLTQKNRLEELGQEIREANAYHREIQLKFDAAASNRQRAEEKEVEERTALRSCEISFQEFRDQEVALSKSLTDARSRMQSVVQLSEALRIDDEELSSEIKKIGSKLSSIELTDEIQNQLQSLKKQLSDARVNAVNIGSAHKQNLNDSQTRAQRVKDLEGDFLSWARRAQNASDQINNLEKRKQLDSEKIREITSKPAEIAYRREGLFKQIKIAESSRIEAGDRLAEAEARLVIESNLRKEKEAALSSSREQRVRCQSALEQIDQSLTIIIERSEEKINAKPELALTLVNLDPTSGLPDQGQVEARVERLKRERENMGAVNLLADQEAQELDERIKTILSEREDLLAAISRLRTGIGNLNREGRQRLLEAFTEVDAYFQQLFTRLFGGGKAHLALTEDDDPLEAGLEVLASPPGKKLQSMSLLSGGEQALTALSLLFAVFLTNPAPICVLDEVDAPLDDANVERFCLLIQEIAEKTGTRFLIVTHHRLTMARVDRLFGVTMGERGVSQLVSVDLKSAENLRVTA
jgi:chromosome segregation protein